MDSRERRGEDVQTESGSAWAKNRALASLVDILPLPALRHRLGRGSRTENTVPRQRKQILRNRDAHCLGILHRHGVDFVFNAVPGHARPYHEAYRSRFEPNEIDVCRFPILEFRHQYPRSFTCESYAIECILHGNRASNDAPRGSVDTL